MPRSAPSTENTLRVFDWIGMPVRPRFLRNSKLKPTDVYFVPEAA